MKLRPHRQVWKNSMYEGSERVALVVAGPGVPPGKVRAALARPAAAMTREKALGRR